MYPRDYMWGRHFDVKTVVSADKKQVTEKFVNNKLGLVAEVTRSRNGKVLTVKTELLND